MPWQGYMLADPAELERCFDDFLSEDGYPCVGAKVARNKKQIELHCFQDIASDSEDVVLLIQLYEFIARYNQQQRMFFSFVCAFTNCDVVSERGFERALWARLQALHNKDSQTHGWDPRVSNNPEDNNFSFSLGGEAFFIIGLNPFSTLRSRKFQYPAIVFNLHSQFQQLKDENKFASMRAQIRKNDQVFCGQVNATLADHGDGSEARQYSGRATGSNWQCPFSKRSGNE